MRIDFDVDLKPARTAKRAQASRPTAGLPGVVKLLVLAYQIEQAIDEGRARDYADIARQLGVTRARVTQIVSLLLLSPDIQAAILTGSADLIGRLSARRLRGVVEDPDWQIQQKRFEGLMAEAKMLPPGRRKRSN